MWDCAEQKKTLHYCESILRSLHHIFVICTSNDKWRNRIKADNFIQQKYWLQRSAIVFIAFISLCAYGYGCVCVHTSLSFSLSLSVCTCFSVCVSLWWMWSYDIKKGNDFEHSKPDQGYFIISGFSHNLVTRELFTVMLFRSERKLRNWN